MRGLWIVMLVGCGRIAFDPLTGGDDVQTGDGGGSGSGDGGGSATGDGGIDAPTQISPNCGTTILINDDFTDGVTASLWNTVTSAGYSVAETGGNVAINFPANAPANTRAGYRQAVSVPFDNTCAIAELAAVPAAAQPAFAYLRLGTPTLNVEVYVLNGNLTAKFTNGGTSGTIGGALAFNPVNHRFLRIRNTGGSNYTFETGPSLTSFPTLLGSQGGMLIAGVSPSSLEVGGSTTTMNAAGAGTAAFSSVVFLAP